MKKYFAFLLLLSFLLSGCIPKFISAEERHKITTISVSDKIEIAPEMYFDGGRGNYIGGFLGGVVVDSIGAARDDMGEEKHIYLNKKELTEIVNENGISIEKIFTEELNNALSQSGKVLVPKNTNQNATNLVVHIYNYGFAYNGIFSIVEPVVSVEISLFNNTGEKIWGSDLSYYASFSDSENQPTFGEINNNPNLVGNSRTTYYAIKKNPKSIENIWRQASKKIASDFAIQL